MKIIKQFEYNIFLRNQGNIVLNNINKVCLATLIASYYFPAFLVLLFGIFLFLAKFHLKSINLVKQLAFLKEWFSGNKAYNADSIYYVKKNRLLKLSRTVRGETSSVIIPVYSWMNKEVENKYLS